MLQTFHVIYGLLNISTAQCAQSNHMDLSKHRRWKLPDANRERLIIAKFWLFVYDNSFNITAIQVYRLIQEAREKKENEPILAITTALYKW